LLPPAMVLPDSERFPVPNVALLIFRMLFPAAVSVPPRVNALIVSVPVEERIGADPVN